MAEASKKLASKEYTLDLRDKNRGKMKNFLKRLIFNYYVGKSYFDDDRSESYLMFQPVFKYFEIFSGTIHKILDGNRNEKKVSKLLQCQKIVFLQNLS